MGMEVEDGLAEIAVALVVQAMGVYQDGKGLVVIGEIAFFDDDLLDFQGSAGGIGRLYGPGGLFCCIDIIIGAPGGIDLDIDKGVCKKDLVDIYLGENCFEDRRPGRSRRP